MESERDREEMLRKQRDKLARELGDFHRRLGQAQPLERAYVEAMVDEWDRAGVVPLDEPTLEQKIIAAEDYLRLPVPIEEFIYGDQYLGRIMKGNVFPRIVEDLQELFAGNYSEIILGGCIGWGKTRFAEIAIAYDLYLLSCLRDPAVAYGMMTGSNMTFVNVSVNVTQAAKVFFKDFYNLIKASPYFQDIFPYDRRLKTSIEFPKNVSCYPVAASEEAALGVGVFCACIDEANFMKVVERSKRLVPGEAGMYDQAESVFKKLTQRMRSRMDQRGKLPGHICVMSSARYPGDLTERMEEQARKEAAEGKHFMFVRHYAHWDTRPASVYLPERFKVEVGDLTRRSRVLDGTEENVNLKRIIEVPMNFKREFEKDADACVRDYCGISTLSIKPFLVRRELIAKMFELGEEKGLKHPYTHLDVTLQQPDPDYERLLPENLHWTYRPLFDKFGRPIIKDGRQATERVLFPALRYTHVDLSKTGDATGLCIGHVVGTKMCPRMNFIDGKFEETREEKPIIYIELMLRIVPPPHGEIDIPRVRGVLYQLRALGMEFGLVTFDTYGSQESVKTMKEQAFRADSFSLDADNEGYEALKDAIYDERVWCYDVPILQRELAQLENTGKKIDHPPKGSKDLADCLAGAVHHCEEGWRTGAMIGGLYQIGEVERQGEPKPNPTKEMAIAKVAEGQTLTDAEENAILFDGLEEL